MANERESVETTRVVKSARPWSGLVLGALFGLALAVVLQQTGIWPLDRLLLFGSAGLFGLVLWYLTNVTRGEEDFQVGALIRKVEISPEL